MQDILVCRLLNRTRHAQLGQGFILSTMNRDNPLECGAIVQSSPRTVFIDGCRLYVPPLHDSLELCQIHFIFSLVHTPICLSLAINDLPLPVFAVDLVADPAAIVHPQRQMDLFLTSHRSEEHTSEL